MPGTKQDFRSALKCIGFEQITVSTVAIGFTVANLADAAGRNAKLAIITIDNTANTGIRYREDGTAPTSTVGSPTPIATYNQLFIYGIDNIKNFKAIRGNQGTPADTVMNCSYFG